MGFHKSFGSGTDTSDATAEQWHVKSGKTAYIDSGKVTGNAYTPAMMDFDGSTGYYQKTGITPTGNAATTVARIKIPDFASSAGAHIFSYASGSFRTLLLITGSSYSGVSQRGKIQLFVQNSVSAEICRIISTTSFNTGDDATIFAAYDATAGTAILRINGQDEDDTGHADRTLTTGTLTTSGSAVMVVARHNTNSTNWVDGQIGFIGHREAYLTNWSDFMYSDGRPKAIDESSWTEWGAQPLIWNEHGQLDNNLGSLGNMTRNGTIVVGKGGNT